MNDEIKVLAEQLVKKATAKKITMAFAESCTGGMIGAAVTEIAGASNVFLGSAVTYSNNAKHNILGVSREVLDQYGAVSRECALMMATAARKIYNSDFAVSVTGVAGPDGGTKEKPVGTVWFGCSSNKKEYSFICHFDGDREDVRIATVKKALLVIIEEMD